MQRVSRRFAFVDPTVVRLHVEWNPLSTRGHAFKPARTAVSPPSCQAWPGYRAARRGPAVGPPGRRVLSLAAPSPSRQVVASLSSRCSAGRRAARPCYKGRLCSQNAPFDEIVWIRLGHSGLARRASCKTPGQSRALEPCEKEGALHPYYLGVTCISPAQTDEIVWISGRRAACAGDRAACAGNRGRLRGRPRPVRGLRMPAVPKRTAARGRPAVRKRVVLSASIARTGTAVALAREVKADFRLVGCLRPRNGLQLGIRSAFRIFRGTKMGFGCRPCLG